MTSKNITNHFKTLQVMELASTRIGHNPMDLDFNAHASDDLLNSQFHPSNSNSYHSANNNFNREITTIFLPDPPPAPNISQTFDPSASLEAACSTIPEPYDSPGLSVAQLLTHFAPSRCNFFPSTMLQDPIAHDANRWTGIDPNNHASLLPQSASSASSHYSPAINHPNRDITTTFLPDPPPAPNISQTPDPLAFPDEAGRIPPDHNPCLSPAHCPAQFLFRTVRQIRKFKFSCNSKPIRLEV